MSLKNVHVAFVLAAIGLCIMYGVQALQAFLDDPRPSSGIAGAAAVAAAVILGWYEARFLRGCREAGIR
ncbi:MAG: hypothetical protein JSU08_04335 [Acidobacteria bacterium]|nr:hypothetical protein [Acidobacteriota bacterium]